MILEPRKNKVCEILFSWLYQKQPLNINNNLYFPSIYYLSQLFCFWNTWAQHRIFTTPRSWCSNAPHSVGEKTLPPRSKLLVLGYKDTEWANLGREPSPSGSGVCALIRCAILSEWSFSAPLLGRSLNKCFGFPGSSDSNAMRVAWVRSLGCEDPLEENMATHSSILAWRIPIDRGAWRVTVHRVAKSQTWLSDSAQHKCVY